MTEASRSSQALVTSYHTTTHHIPESSNPYIKQILINSYHFLRYYLNCIKCTKFPNSGCLQQPGSGPTIHLQIPSKLNCGSLDRTASNHSLISLTTKMNNAKERETITKNNSAITLTLPEKNTVSSIKEPYYGSKATHF